MNNELKNRLLKVISVAQERVNNGSCAHGCFSALRKEIEMLFEEYNIVPKEKVKEIQDDCLTRNR